MKIRPFLEYLTEEQLQRIIDAEKWNSMCGTRLKNGTGCLICHASNDNYVKFISRSDLLITASAEERYMRLTVNHSQKFAGKRMQQMARAVLARRKIKRYKVEENVVHV